MGEPSQRVGGSKKSKICPSFWNLSNSLDASWTLKKDKKAIISEGSPESIQNDLKEIAKISGILKNLKNKDLEQVKEIEKITKKLNGQLSEMLMNVFNVAKTKDGLKQVIKMTINYIIDELYQNSLEKPISASTMEIQLPMEAATHFYKNFEESRRNFSNDYGAIRAKFLEKSPVFEQPKKGLIIKDVLIDNRNNYLYMLAHCHGSVGGCYLQTFNYTTNKLLYSLPVTEKSMCFIKVCGMDFKDEERISYDMSKRYRSNTNEVFEQKETGGPAQVSSLHSQTSAPLLNTQKISYGSTIPENTPVTASPTRKLSERNAKNSCSSMQENSLRGNSPAPYNPPHPNVVVAQARDKSPKREKERKGSISPTRRVSQVLQSMKPPLKARHTVTSMPEILTKERINQLNSQRKEKDQRNDSITNKNDREKEREARRDRSKVRVDLGSGPEYTSQHMSGSTRRESEILINPDKYSTIFYIMTEQGHVTRYNLYDIEVQFGSNEMVVPFTRLDGVNCPSCVVQSEKRPGILFMADNSFNIKIYDKFEYKMDVRTSYWLTLVFRNQSTCASNLH